MHVGFKLFMTGLVMTFVGSVIGLRSVTDKRLEPIATTVSGTGIAVAAIGGLIAIWS